MFTRVSTQSSTTLPKGYKKTANVKLLREKKKNERGKMIYVHLP